MIVFYAVYLDAEGRAHGVGPHEVDDLEAVRLAVLDHLSTNAAFNFVCAFHLSNPPQMLLDRAALNAYAASPAGRAAMRDYFLQQELAKLPS